MKIHRLALHDYRGIGHVDLSFASSGTTIIEGPNEIGKTSLAESIGLVFDVPDSSNSVRIKALQPTGRDVGTSVTVEVSTGPYRFVLTKVWNKSRRTELSVLEPRPEQLTGRSAHDRVQEMLTETLDRTLWDALRFLQGGNSESVSFGEVASLGKVLDRSTGADQAGERDDDLWTRVCAERDKYWTATGQPRVERTHLSSHVDTARDEVDRVSRELDELAFDADEFAALGIQIASIDAGLNDRERAIDDLATRVDDVAAMRGELQRLDLHETVARQLVEQAQSAAAAREVLVAAVEIHRGVVAEIEADLARWIPTLDGITEREVGLRSRRSQAHEVVVHAEKLATLRAADREFRRQQIEIEQLTERRDRVLASRAALVSVEAVLGDATVDERLVDALEAAELDVARAQAAARAAGATVTLRAGTATRVQLDHVDTSLDPDVPVELVVGSRMSIQVGDLSVSVEPGLDARTLADAAAVADATLAKLRLEAGVETMGDARRLAERRVQAVRARDEAHQLIRESLRDLTFEQIVAKVDGHADRIESYLRDRPFDPPMAEDFETSKTLAAVAERELAAARAEVARADSLVDGIAAESLDLQVEHASRLARADHARASHRAAAESLADARSVGDDEALVAAGDRVGRELEDAHAARALAARRLAEVEPDTVDAQLANARLALDRSVATRGELADARRDLHARLAARGELGLRQVFHDASSQVERGTRELARYDARAAAALRLHRAFANARASARRRYTAPFRHRIQQLGRIVFGPDFEVSLDENLGVASRTLGGLTLPVDQLSGGAREQLDLITRLACAAIVSSDGGAPVVVDDALGWSDPSRLEAMGATIGLASRDCQVIVLTCSPDRFASVGNARVVRFADAQRNAAPGISEGEPLDPVIEQLDVT